ncbi:MAG: hypothetical protein U0800_02370 [Isosphaeraceae bacterium]
MLSTVVSRIINVEADADLDEVVGVADLHGIDRQGSMRAGQQPAGGVHVERDPQLAGQHVGRAHGDDPQPGQAVPTRRPATDETVPSPPAATIVS